MPRFLLKNVKHVNNVLKSHSVHCPIGVTFKVIHDLQHAGAPEAFHWLRERCLKTDLRVPKSTANPALYVLRKALQIVAAAADPSDGFRFSLAQNLNPGPLSLMYACSGIFTSGTPEDNSAKLMGSGVSCCSEPTVLAPAARVPASSAIGIGTTCRADLR